MCRLYFKFKAGHESGFSPGTHEYTRGNTRGSCDPRVFEDPGLNFEMVGTRHEYQWVYSGCNYLSNDANIIILDQKLTKLHENY